MVAELKRRPLLLPEPLGIATVEARVYPAARKSQAHVVGTVDGYILVYQDLHAFAWWHGGGWVTLNRGKKGLRRIHRGAEDVTRVRR